MRFISIILFGAIAAYMITLGGIYGLQRDLLYHPNQQHLSPQVLNNLPPGITEEAIKTGDGETLVAWYSPAQNGNPTILFFPGNAGHLPYMADRLKVMHKLGFGYLAVAYRGYSGSTGEPSEEGLHQDALASYAWLAERVKPDMIIVHGAALGASVATHLASQVSARALVLEAPYTAAVDVAASRFWFLPVKYFFKDQFLTREWIKSVKMPILVVHGDEDTIVPVDQGKAVFALAPEPKEIVIIKATGHNNLSEKGLYDVILAFAMKHAPK